MTNPRADESCESAPSVPHEREGFFARRTGLLQKTSWRARIGFVLFTALLVIKAKLQDQISGRQWYLQTNLYDIGRLHMDKHCHTDILMFDAIGESQSKPERIHEFHFSIASRQKGDRAWQFQDTIPAEYRDKIKVDIAIISDMEHASSDIEFSAHVVASHNELLESVAFLAGADELKMSFACEELPEDASIQVMAKLYLRPFPRFVTDGLVLRSEIASMWFQSTLDWEIKQLSVHSTHGSILFRLSEVFMTLHNVNLTSVTGDIVGWIYWFDNLYASTSSGSIDLYPDLEESFRQPGDLRQIRATTDSGDIKVHMTVPMNPSLFVNLATHIQTVSGNIETRLLHSLSTTNFTSRTGNISASIIPFGAIQPRMPNHLSTTTEHGNIEVSVDEAHTSDLSPFSPSFDMTSMHCTKHGTLSLHYPVDWFGDINLEIGHGPLKFKSDLLEDVERDKTRVRAIRGKGGRSRLHADVGTGSIEMHIGG